MKRISNLYDKMICYSNVLFVFNRIKNKSHNKNKIMLFMRYKNCYLFDILEKLRNNSYSFSNYHIFLIHEKKYRIIIVNLHMLLIRTYLNLLFKLIFFAI